jgi:hypothetical protein
VIDPGGIPAIPGDMEALAGHAAALRGVGNAFATTGQRINTIWQQLGGVYHAPEVAQLLAATAPVQTISASVGEDIGILAGALASYADEVRQIQAQMASLRAQASEFVASVAGDEHWRGDGDKVDHNNQLIRAVDAQLAAFFDAQRRCANTINALYGGPQYRAEDGDTAKQLDAAGSQDKAQDKAQDKTLPWGHTEEHDRGLLGDIGAFFGGITDGAVGLVTGLGALIGRDPTSGTWCWDTAGTAWKGAGTLVVAAGVYLTPGGRELDHTGGIPGLDRGQLGTTLLGAGKSIIAYDEWGKDPARAAGMATFTIVSAVVSTKGVGAGLRTAGTAARGSRLAAVSSAGTVMVRSGEAIGKLPTVSELATNAGQRIPGLRLPDLADTTRITIPHHTDISTSGAHIPLPTSHPHPGSVGDALSRTPNSSLPGHTEIPSQRVDAATPAHISAHAHAPAEGHTASSTHASTHGSHALAGEHAFADHRSLSTTGDTPRTDYDANPDFKVSAVDRDTFHNSYAGYAADAAFVRDLQAHNPTLSGLTEEELVAIRGYTSDEFCAPMNEGLRKGDVGLLQQYDSHIRTLVSGLNQLPPHEGVVGRGLTVEPAKLQDLVNRYEPGQVVREPSFLGADTRAEFPGNVQFEIYSRTGRNIGELSHFPGSESEVLFPPGSTFRVLERSFDSTSGTWYIRMLQHG